MIDRTIEMSRQGTVPPLAVGGRVQASTCRPRNVASTRSDITTWLAKKGSHFTAHCLSFERRTTVPHSPDWLQDDGYRLRLERDGSRASHPHNMSLTRNMLTAFFRVG
jgi:hypothetical protein